MHKKKLTWWWWGEHGKAQGAQGEGAAAGARQDGSLHSTPEDGERRDGQGPRHHGWWWHMLCSVCAQSSCTLPPTPGQPTAAPVSAAYHQHLTEEPVVQRAAGLLRHTPLSTSERERGWQPRASAAFTPLIFLDTASCAGLEHSVAGKMAMWSPPLTIGLFMGSFLCCF